MIQVTLDVYTTENNTYSNVCCLNNYYKVFVSHLVYVLICVLQWFHLSQKIPCGKNVKMWVWEYVLSPQSIKICQIQEKKMNVPDLPDVPEDLTILDGATTSVQSIGGWYAQILARRRRQRSTVDIQKWWRRRITNLPESLPESPTKILNKNWEVSDYFIK